jgi:hypothetical protein
VVGPLLSVVGEMIPIAAREFPECASNIAKTEISSLISLKTDN